MSSITLISKDEMRIEVSRDACMLSSLLKDLLADDDTITQIPITTVEGVTLKKIIDYMEVHWKRQAPELEKPLRRNLKELLGDWDRQFVETNSEDAVVFDIINGANFLGVKDLLELTSAVVAEKMKSQSVEEIRAMFGLKNDFTEEEEEALKRERCIE